MSKFLVLSNLEGWKPSDLPMNAFVSICLAEYIRTQNGMLSLTAQLATDTEIDLAVNGLIDDLEKIRKQAKARVEKDNEKVRTALGSRG